MMASASQAPAAYAPPVISLADLRELRALAKALGGLLGKIDNITHLIGGLTDRFDDDRDGAAADYLLAEIETITTAADGDLWNIMHVLESYLEGASDE